MNDNVIAFPQRATYDGALCSCGSAWFRLTHSADRAVPGSCCLTTDGTVTGWSGQWECCECGQPWFPRSTR